MMMSTLGDTFLVRFSTVTGGTLNNEPPTADIIVRLKGASNSKIYIQITTPTLAGTIHAHRGSYFSPPVSYAPTTCAGNTVVRLWPITKKKMRVVVSFSQKTQARAQRYVWWVVASRDASARKKLFIICYGSSYFSILRWCKGL